jgi:hypothetical protein
MPSAEPFIAVPLSLPAQPDAAAAGSPHIKPRLGAIATGWTYLWADQGGGERANLNGWYLRPSFNLARGYSLFANSTNYYGANHKGSVNSHGFTFGLGKQFFRSARIRPSVFAEVGDVRASNAGVITHQFIFAAGCGLAVPLNRHVDLVLTPAQYVFLYPHGDPRHVYNAKVGLSFPFGHR